MTPAITHRPLKLTSRRDGQGNWRCSGTHGCGRYLPLSAFWMDRRNNRPMVYCRACFNAYKKRLDARKAMTDDLWWRQQQDRTNRRSVRLRSIRRRSERQERAALASGVVVDLEERGVSRGMIERVARVSHETITRMLHSGELTYTGVLDRLVLLQLVVREYPIWYVPRTGATRPDEDVITRRYRALQEAQR